MHLPCRPQFESLLTLCPGSGFATIAVLVMEQAGTVKLGPSVNEFESTKDGGKVVKFDDVKGCEEAKDELQEIVEFRALAEPHFDPLCARLLTRSPAMQLKTQRASRRSVAACPRASC